MPGLSREGGQQQAGRGGGDADFHHEARPTAVHQPPQQRAEHRGDDEAERESARGHAALPAELIEDRRKEQRESRARVDADGHRDEDDGDDEPAVEEGQAAGELFDQAGGS